MTRPFRISEQQALEFKHLYEDEGWTVEQIALGHGYHNGTVYRALKRVNTAMRSSTSRTSRLPASRMTDGIKGKRDTPIRQGTTRNTFFGHRRRGKL